MISLNSSDTSTTVVNSRPSKKSPIVWRRRKGVPSGQIFTTYERISLAEVKPIMLPNGNQATFNLGKLLISVAKSFSHNTHAAEYESLWLAQTVEAKLCMSSDTLTPSSIAQETYQTLKRFDAIAAINYGAKHGIISTVRRRGRPSLNE